MCNIALYNKFRKRDTKIESESILKLHKSYYIVQINIRGGDKKLKTIVKNKKAISPVLAVLLMIAVAVAAALITYAWVMTYLSSTTSRAGHAIQIQSVAFTGTEATVYAQNVGDGTIEITDAYLDGAYVTPTFLDPDAGITLEGETSTLTIAGAYTTGKDYYIKIVCEDGTFTEGKYTMN